MIQVNIETAKIHVQDWFLRVINVCVRLGCVTLTYDGGEASCGFIPCDQLVKLRVVKLQTFQKCHISPLSFSVEDVE